MSIKGKRIIIPGADFSALRIISETKRSIPMLSVAKTFDTSSDTFSSNSIRAIVYGNFKKGEVLEYDNPDSSFDNKMCIFRLEDRSTPKFFDGKSPESEHYVSTSRAYEYGTHEFSEDGRFMGILRDTLNDLTRDFSPYASFGLFKLTKKYEIGKPFPIYAYFGTYTTNTSSLIWGSDIRAIAVLDHKIGDTVESAVPDDIKFNVVRIADNTHCTYDSMLANDFVTTKWTSDKDQRVLVVARSDSSPNGSVSSDPENVFRVTFNS